MNKYLTKIAQLPKWLWNPPKPQNKPAVPKDDLGEDDEGYESEDAFGGHSEEEIVAMLHVEDKAAGRPYRDYANQKLVKKALDLHSQHAKELQDTAVIGGLGGLTGMASHRILSGLKNKPSNKAVFAVSTGMGLAADYAGIKLNKALDGFHHKKETNVPL